MRENVRQFVRVAAGTLPFQSPILEIGSRPAAGQEEIADLHSFFPGTRYVGSDYLPGPNVDILLDVHLLGIGDAKAGSIVMMDTLEHVQDPIVAMRDVYRAMRPGGIVIASSHMAFPIHNHPWDYWRYTPAAFDLIFQPFESRAVWSQGDPLAPWTVLAAARKGADLDTKLAFDTAAAALERAWPDDALGGPLLRFEPLLEVLARDIGISGRPEPAVSGLTPDTTIEQTFVCPSNDLTRIYAKFTTNGRMNFCHVNFQLRDEETQQVVAERRLFAQHFTDNIWVPFTFPAIVNSAGRTYRIVLASWDGRGDSAVAPLLSDEPATSSEALFINGERCDRLLCFRALCGAPAYQPSDYRRLAALTGPLARPAGASASEHDLLRQIALAQSAQLSQVMERVEDRLDQTAARIDGLERNMQGRLELLADEIENVRSFVQALRSNFVYKAAARAGGLIRRRKP